MDEPKNHFKMYEPRPEYRYAARVSEENLIDLANWFNYHRRDGSPIAYARPSTYSLNGHLLLLAEDGSEVIWRAWIGDFIEQIGYGQYVVVKHLEFRKAQRLRVGDDL